MVELEEVYTYQGYPAVNLHTENISFSNLSQTNTTSAQPP